MKPIAVRRLGSGRVHLAEVPAELLYPAASFGVACTGVQTPVVALCGAVLRGFAIEIPAGDSLDSWLRADAVCRPCLLLSRRDAGDPEPLSELGRGR